MSDLRYGSLFSGYEGLTMGVQSVLGGSTAWVSDIDKGANKILAHRFPDVPNLGDISAVDWSSVEPVDVLTGGTPCQDLSHAGKRAGMTEGTRSNLWVAMREAIAALRPSLVVWENVRGAYSAAADSDLGSNPGLLAGVRRRGDGEPLLRALGRVLGDLSELGFDAEWHGLRAADVGAPHGRFRVFVVAYPNGEGRGSVGWLDAARRDAHGRRGPHGLRSAGQPAALLPSPRTSDTNGAGHHGDGGMDLRTAVSLLPTPVTNDMDAWTAKMKAAHGNGSGHGASLAIEAQRLLPTPRSRDKGTEGDYSSESHRPTLAQGLGIAGPPGQERVPASTDHWGQYADAIARWEHATRPAPAPTELGPKGNPRLSARFSEWLMGLPDGWITDVPGITRNEALKAAGNGVVPQQAAEAMRRTFAVLAMDGSA